MTTSDLQPSGLSAPTQTNAPTNPDNLTPLRPVRTWTRRMGQALGLPRRRIQKLLLEGAPDATDDATTDDWSAHELAWRGWISHHPRYRTLARRMRSSTDLDTSAKNAGSAAAGAVSGAWVEVEADPVKRRKCQLLDLEINEKLGVLVDRAAAKDLLQQTLQMALTRIDELPALLAMQVPIEHRDLVKAKGRALCLIERTRFEADIRRLWTDRMPRLIPRSTPMGTT